MDGWLTLRPCNESSCQNLKNPVLTQHALLRRPLTPEAVEDFFLVSCATRAEAGMSPLAPVVPSLRVASQSSFLSLSTLLACIRLVYDTVGGIEGATEAGKISILELEF